MILILDNYDSFTYNLVDLVKRFTPVKVFRNDEITCTEIFAHHPTGILISPGPGRPEDSKVSFEFVQKFPGEIPILGVCLGHQIIGQVFGAGIGHAARPMHGKTSPVLHEGKSVFRGLPSPLEVMRYHSLVVHPEGLPPDLEVTAHTEDGEIMGVAHRKYRLEGVQFHPESILSKEGEKMIENWLQSLSTPD